MIYRLLKRIGIGLIPKELFAIYESEGIVCYDETLYCSLTCKEYDENKKYFTKSRKRFIGSLLITNKRFVVFSSNEDILNLQFGNKDSGCVIDSTLRKLKVVLAEYTHGKKRLKNYKLIIHHTTAPQIHSILTKLMFQ
ncbi:MAG: hypothetical protein KKA84_07370 [Bacteroidetes bacterium]|nr:hypothetical protein [Bacteroidota bacterium]